MNELFMLLKWTSAVMFVVSFAVGCLLIAKAVHAGPRTRDMAHRESDSPALLFVALLLALLVVSVATIHWGY